ncbi:MAG: hypothetical protein HYY93_11480 [Planctomycetes bacterium]|nr:hypothetical protein [Planctomycetota bacterium]
MPDPARVNLKDPLRARSGEVAGREESPADRGTRRSSRRKPLVLALATALLLFVWDVGCIAFCKMVEYDSDGCFLVALFGGLFPLYILFGVLQVRHPVSQATLFGLSINLVLMSLLLLTAW